MDEATRERYRRQLLLDEIGEKGQERLARSSVLIIGAGGLGSPLSYYLAAAGVGRIGLIDSDVVSLSNMNRQILYTEDDLGAPKAGRAAGRLRALNGTIQIDAIAERFTPENAAVIASDYELLLDGTDNIETRMLINRVACSQAKPAIFGGVRGLYGQVFTVTPGRGPCLSCLMGAEPPQTPHSETPVLGAIAGVIGCLEAIEAVKILLGTGRALTGRLLILDGLTMKWDELQIKPDPSCTLCGPRT